MADATTSKSKYFGSGNNQEADANVSGSATSKYFGNANPDIPLYEQSVERDIAEDMETVITNIDAGDWNTSDSLQTARAITDGMWMNKGEEAGAWIGAAAYKLFGMYGSEDKTVSQIKDEMLNRSEADTAAFIEKRPVVAIGANIAGNIMSPVSLKGGQLLGQAANLRKAELARQSSVATRTATQAATGSRGAVGATAAQADEAGKLAQQLSGFSPRAYNIATQTRTPLLGAGLVAGESAVIGAEGDTLGERAQNAAISGVLGGVFGLGMSGLGVGVNAALKSRTAQEIGKGKDFVSLMFTEHALAPVYQHVVSKAFGGRSLIENQVRSLRNRMPSLTKMKERKTNVVENAKVTLARATAIAKGDEKVAIEQAKRLQEDLRNELTANGKIAFDELDAISKQRITDLDPTNNMNAVKAAAARDADSAVNAVEASFRTETLVKSLPTNARAGLADEIEAMSPQDALKAVREAWSTTGFSAAKNADYKINLSTVEKAIEKLIKKNATKVALAGANGKTAAATINNYVAAMIKERTKNGIMKGDDLIQLRSEIGTVINNLSDNQAATREITKPIQRYFDDLLISRLDSADAASFLKDRELWKLKSTLEDAVSVATGRNKDIQGAFGADDWIAANKKQGTYFSSVGEGVLQKEAQEVNKLANRRAELIKSNAEADLSLMKKQSIEAIDAERSLLAAQKREADKAHDVAKTEIQRQFRGSSQNAAAVTARKTALETEKARFSVFSKDLDATIAKLDNSKAFFDANAPKNGSIFERMFATGLLASVVAPFAQSVTFGLNVAAAGTGAAKLLSQQGTQRFLAGQTGAQRAGSEMAQRLDEAAQKLAERTGVNYRPVAATAIAPDASDKKVFNEQTKRSIMGQGQVAKARIYTGLQNAGKLGALEAQDPILYKALKDAFDAQSN